MTSADIVWPHATREDTRTPLFTFEVSSDGEDSTTTYGFFFLSVPVWLNTLCCIVGSTLISAVTGAIVYNTIVQPRKHKSPGLPLQETGVIVAFGLILPFWIFAPLPLMNYFGIHNMLFRFLLSGVTPTVAMFRTTEALFGFTPEHAKRSLGDFALYFGSTLLLRFDNKAGRYIRTNPRVFGYHVLSFAGMLTVTGLWQSCFISSSYFPSMGANTLPEGWYSSMVSIRMWKHMLQTGFLLLFYLTAMTEGFALTTQLLTGIQTERVNDYPLTSLESPSDFWGRKWNRVVHTALKNGVYKPVRALGGSNALGVLAAFMASGLFHEFLLPKCILNYDYSFGGTTFFFVWHAMLVAGEAMIGHWFVFQFIKLNFPIPLRSLLLICLGIPAAHYFFDPYVNSEFFLDGNVFFPMILPWKN